ncbi:RNA polymerase sigma factor [Candidatus Poribacteria bacterium]
MLRVKEEGDESAFEQLIQRHRKPILNFVYRFMGNSEAAEDLSQDVFLRLWASASTYLPVAKFTTFLYTIAKNLCLNTLAKSRNAPPMQSLDDTDSGSAIERGNVSVKDGLADPAGSPEREVVGKEIVDSVEEAVGKLSPEHRLVFVLTEYHGHSYQEVATIAQCPVGTVASRKNAAVRQLRQRLAALRQ